MTLKVTGIRTTVATLRISRQKIRKGIKKASLQSAQAIKSESEQNAPYLTGTLEGSHTIIDVTEFPDDPKFIIEFQAINPDNGFDYGTEMHESVYNLGPLSQQKQASNGHIVGRKFLARAIASERDKCVELVKEATQKALKDARKHKKR